VKGRKHRTDRRERPKVGYPYFSAHSSDSLETCSSTFIIDNTLAVEAGALASRLSMGEQKAIDAVILTTSHMDHIKDIPAIALNFYRAGGCFDVYSTPEVCDIIQIHLLNNVVFPEFHKNTG